jgi:hypothetical protein
MQSPTGSVGWKPRYISDSCLETLDRRQTDPTVNGQAIPVCGEPEPKKARPTGPGNLSVGKNSGAVLGNAAAQKRYRFSNCKQIELSQFGTLSTVCRLPASSGRVYRDLSPPGKAIIHSRS